MHKRIAFWIVLLVSAQSSVHAEDFCVSNAVEFQDALWQAQINAQNNHIKLVTGTYHTSDNGNLDSGFEYVNSMPGSLTISGGWQVSGAGVICTLSRTIVAASETILSGDHLHRVLSIAAGDANANVTIINLTIQDGFPYTDNGATGGLQISGFDGNNDLVADVLIDRVIFRQNQGNYASTLTVNSSGSVHVRNSLFWGNEVNISYTAGLSSNGSEPVYFTNNTVVANTTLSANGVSGVFLQNTGSGGIVAANNILWDNTLWDIVFSGTSANHHLLYNVLQTVIGNAGTNIGNSNANPMLGVDFTLTQDSPALDAGVVPTPGQPNTPVELDWELGDYDVDAHSREMGLSVDMGAIEFLEVIFIGTFE